MTLLRYGLSRNVEARDAKGRKTLICMAVIEHENGFQQRLAIPEELIQYAGEGIIELEIKEAALKGGEEYVRSK